MRQPRLRARLLLMLILLTLSFIWGNSLDSRAASLDKSGRVLALLRPYILALPLPALHAPEAMSAFVRKLAHFVEFFILGGQLMLLWRLIRPRVRMATPLALSVGAACIDEGLQFVSGRAPMVQDVLLDSLGALAGIVLVWLLRSRGSRIRGTGHA